MDRIDLKRNLEAVQARIARTAGAGRPEDEEDPVRAFGLFDDALMAAELATAAGEPATRIESSLATAARAAVAVFRPREGLGDPSTVNPDTYVRAVYAALAAGEDEPLAFLASVDPDAFAPEGVDTAPEVDEFAAGLARAAAGDRDGALERVAPVARNEDAIPYWRDQARVLDALLTRDEAAVPAALEQLRETLRAWRVSVGDEIEPTLELPLAGLEALARKLKGDG